MLECLWQKAEGLGWSPTLPACWTQAQKQPWLVLFSESGPGSWLDCEIIQEHWDFIRQTCNLKCHSSPYFTLPEDTRRSSCKSLTEFVFLSENCQDYHDHQLRGKMKSGLRHLLWKCGLQRHNFAQYWWEKKKKNIVKSLIVFLQLIHFYFAMKTWEKIKTSKFEFAF